ncbi:MAG: glycosyltransferase family 2 protein [Anaerolineales bacterium]
MDLKEIRPLVTVLIPIRNEERYIGRCLEAVLAQGYPAERMEVLVIDGMSTDGTRGIVQEIMDRGRQAIDHSPSPTLHRPSSTVHRHPSIRLLDNPAKIVPSALNTGLSQAKGEILIRVDGHTRVAQDYVLHCTSALDQTEADNAGGRMSAVGEGFFGRAVALATSSPFGVGGARFHYSDEEEWVDTVYMGAWRRELFDRVGLFDEEMIRGQDDEFNYRLRAAGGQILLSPKIRSEYMVRSSPGALWHQYFQYGYWKVRVLQKHPRQMQPRQFVPPLFVGSLLLGALLAALTSWGGYAVALIAGTYLLANLATSIWTAARRGWRYLPLLPPIFAILHLSYGSGFLVGLFRLAHRWRDRQGKVPFFETADA